MKNILLLFLSTVRMDKENPQKSHYEFYDKTLDKELCFDTTQTNESALIYLNNILAIKNERVDKVYLFASEKVRKESINISGNLTHLEYFKGLVHKNMSYSSVDDIVVCPYKDDASNEDSLAAIAEMAEHIMAGQKELRDNVTLHADMTGGMRHASMMMLGVMRLLEFSGIKMGKVLYSNWHVGREKNWVEEASDVYRFFDLVAGAKEFKNFGSVKEILDYFDKVPSPQEKLKSLIDAMKTFSERIKLCRYGEFKSAIDGLSDNVDVFKAWLESGNGNQEFKDANGRLFVAMLPTIYDEYEKLLVGKPDDLTIIEWCVDKGYLQQAMTLYTERIPEYIVEERLVEIPEQRIKDLDYQYQKAEAEAGGKRIASKNYFTVINYAKGVSPDRKDFALLDEFRNFFIDYLNVIFRKNKAFSPGFWNQDLLLLKNSQDVLEKEIEQFFVLKCMIENFKNRYSDRAIFENFDVLPKMLMELFALKDNGESRLDIIKENYPDAYLVIKNKYSNSANELTLIDPVDLRSYVGWFLNHCLNSKNYHVKLGISIKKAYIDYCERAYDMLEMIEKSNLLYNGSDVNELMDVIDTYMWIRSERNAVNHAHDEAEKYSVQDVENQIRNGIKLLRKLKEESLAKEQN